MVLVFVSFLFQSVSLPRPVKTRLPVQLRKAFKFLHSGAAAASIVFSESHPKSHYSNLSNRMEIPGYRLFRCDRPIRKGGEVPVYLKH